ncbi:HEAT repeat domain-containing protein [Streptomyces sp. NPDC058646]|uniref:HEAT repeat domain-containing protein n=1 Tax=Streptomyces sp. NPDC058646 TaxID=3346574 RepID=UPI0036525946
MCTLRAACLGQAWPRVYPAARGQYFDTDVGPLGHDRLRSDFAMGWCDVGEWRTDPTLAMCRALADGAELSSFAGGPFDVRAVMADLRPEAKDDFLLGEVPWEHFPQGNRVREAVHLLHTGDSPGRSGTGVVSGMCANDMRAAAVLAVPFLIRIAADTRHPHRVDALAEVSCPARARHFGVASRDQLLLHRAETYDDLYDGYGVEVSGYPAGWSIDAARAAITADTALLRSFLDDPDPAIRIRAAYALATPTDRTVRAVFRTRLAVEQDPIVRAALVLATAEATRAHPHPPTTEWIRERWRDRAQAPEVLLAAAIGWLCLTEEPAPDDLRATVDDLATDERAHAMDVLPWMAAAGASDETGLQRCVRKMLHPEPPDPVGYDDPWAPHR